MHIPLLSLRYCCILPKYQNLKETKGKKTVNNSIQFKIENYAMENAGI